MDNPLARAVFDIVNLTTSDSADGCLDQASQETWSLLTLNNSDCASGLVIAVTIKDLTDGAH